MLHNGLRRPLSNRISGAVVNCLFKADEEAIMKIANIRVTREQMEKRVARFKDLEGFDGGLPDSTHPDAIRTLYNVIGFLLTTMIDLC